MPMRMGELMVVVRAQDFASRTLRRVGSELSHMSREQMIAARRQDVLFNKQRAMMRVQEARMPFQNLQIIADRNRLLGKQAAQTQKIVEAEQRLARVRPVSKGMQTLVPPVIQQQIRQAEAAVQTAINQQKIYERGAARLQQQIDRMPAAFQRAAKSGYEFTRMMQRSNRQLFEAHNALSQAQRAELAFNQAMARLPIVRLHETARALSGIGRTLQLFGAVSTVAFGYAADAAASFDTRVSLAATQMTRLQAGSKETSRNADELGKRLLALSADFPFAANEMADAVYEIFSGTNIQSIDKGINLLEAFARVAVAGQVDIKDATKAGIIILNNFAGAGENVGDTLNRMFAIVRFGFMRFEDFTGMIPKVAAAAAGSGQSLDDMGGAMAFLTRRTGNATIAATQISRAFDVLTRKEFQEGIVALGKETGNFGLSVTDAEGRLKPLPKLLHDLVTAFPELRQGGKSLERFIQIVTRAADPKTKGLIATTEARRFFRFIFRGYDEYSALQKKVTGDNTEFMRSFNELMQSQGVQWELFTNRVRIAIMMIGQEAIPVFAQIGEWIARAIDWWQRLDDSTRGLIIRWSVMISIGTLIAGVLASLIGALITLGAGFYSAGAKVFKLIAALLGFKKVLDPTVAGTARLASLLIFLGSIGAIVIGIKLEKQGDSIVWDFVGKGLQAGGVAGLISKATRGKIPFLKAFPGAAAALELIFPDDIAGTNKFEKTVNESMKRIADSVNKRTKGAAPIVAQAQKMWQQMFSTGTGTIAQRAAAADALVRRYFARFGLVLKKNTKDAKTNADSWESFAARLKNAFKKGDFDKIQKIIKDAMGGNTLSDLDNQWDQFYQDQNDRARQLADTAQQAQDQAVSSLRNMYMEMEDVNRRAFGDLFQGPWLTSETFDLAKDWGIQPRAADIIKDLSQQTERFTKRGQMLGVLAKRGLPREFLNELKQMTPEEVMPILYALVNATPKQTAKLIALLKNREKLIKQATKIDFTNEIESFRKAGISMADAMRDGFQSAKIGAWFDNWVQAKFPQIIAAAVAKAVAEFKRQNPAPQAPPGKPPKNARTTAMGGTANATYTNDTSRTINIHMHDHGDDRSAEGHARIRRKAFTVANQVKGQLI